MKLSFLNAPIEIEIGLPDCAEENVHEEVVGGRGHVALGQKHLVVAALHEVLLERDRMADVDVGLDDLRAEELDLGVELGEAIAREQTQQVEAEQLVLVRRFWQLFPFFPELFKFK